MDISAVVDRDMLDKYDLKPDNAILATEKHIPIYQELMEKYQVEYIAGGATQNSMRIGQWLLGTVHAFSCFGCIGKDELGKKLVEKTKEAGVSVHYQIDDNLPTGICIALITGQQRSLVTSLKAASHFKKSHIEKEENWKIVENASFYYISGYFLTVSPESILMIAEHARKESKHFIMNLSAPYLCQKFKEPMMRAIPYVDVLFGNETEAATFAKEQGFQTEDIKEIALKTAALDKVTKERSRLVVFTQGPGPTIVAEEGTVREFPVIPIKEEDIVDTIGAGDAFVGGFLSQLVQGRSVLDCIKAAHYAANYIIQQSGVTIRDKPQLNLEGTT